ncbi:phosphodiester glycosidase family protein [Actinoplanes sp. NPDC051859]|uniref:phosphodiester glycosidase family protein n=1 Tax=Actinoplanes sp. NPDC051859 TaxID=3363909 RepID=UPI0037AFDF69
MVRHHRIRSIVVAVAALPALAAPAAGIASPRPAAAGTGAPTAVAPLPGPGDRLPLGSDNLVTTVGAVQTPAPGVTYRKYTHGKAASAWTVAMYFDSDNPNDKVVFTRCRSSAVSLRDRVAGHGYDASVITFTPPPPADLPYRELNPNCRDVPDATHLYGVRSGKFPERAGAAGHLRQLEGSGLKGVVEHEAFREQNSTGPWEIRVLAVEPTAAVTIGGAHGPELRSADTVRDIARHAGALAAVNGSDFDIRNNPEANNNPDFNGFDGDPIGIYVQDNNLLSEAVNGRTALLLNGANGRQRITELTTSTTVQAPDGEKWQIDGVHRKPGRVASCGGVGGDLRPPSKPGGVPGDLPGADKPWRFEACTDPDEIVTFRPEWGPATPAPDDGVDSVDVVVDGNWVAKQLRSPAGGPIPAGSRVLQGIGAGAQWLRDHTVLDKAFQPSTQILDAQGQRVTSSTFAAISGGPALVRGGEVWINVGANGYRARDGYHTSVFVDRHPRTMVGITATGQLLLVVIDGRRPGVSVGVTMPEAAKVMKWLGAVDAMMLGMGGDSTLTINNILYNRPTDNWETDLITERRVGNAIVLRRK